MSAAVIDLDVYRTEREERELGPAQFMTLAQVRNEIDRAVDEMLGEQRESSPPPFHIDEDDDDRPTPLPCERIDGTFRPAKVQRRRWRELGR